MKVITKIEVWITDIKTDDKYYSFKYQIWINGNFKYEAEYENDHSWYDDHKSFRKVLKDGYAAKLALEHAL